MESLEPRLRRDPRVAMAGGASRQEIDYLIKKAWLKQHEMTQRLAKDEVWELDAGFSSDEGRVAYFDLPERMGEWRIHLSLDYGVMKAIDVECSESDIRDAIIGGSAGVVMRSHATAEVLGRNDDRNPHYYYGTGKVTPKKDFWSTREGKAANELEHQPGGADRRLQHQDRRVRQGRRRGARGAARAQGDGGQGRGEPAVGRLRPFSASSF